MKNNNGITLIALVITIIVLLILAGVSIMMLSGDNSILGNARDAGILNAVNSAKEQVTLVASSAVGDAYREIYVENKAEVTISSVETAALNGIASNAYDQVTYTPTLGTDNVIETVLVEYTGSANGKTYGWQGTVKAESGAISWIPSEDLNKDFELGYTNTYTEATE